MKKTVKRISAIIMICIIIISSLSFQVPDRAYAGDVITAVGVSTILEALKDVFMGTALGRAGLSSSSSTRDLYFAARDVTDDLLDQNAQVLYWMSPIAWPQAGKILYTELFEEDTYEDYCDYYNYDPALLSSLNSYVEDTGIGTSDTTKNTVTLNAPIVNNFSEFIRLHKTEMTEKLEDAISSKFNLPYFKQYLWFDGNDYSSIGLNDFFTEFGIVANQTHIVSKDFRNNDLPSGLINILGQLPAIQGFDIYTTPFIFSYSGNYCRLITLKDEVILCFDRDYNFYNVYDYGSLISMWKNKSDLYDEELNVLVDYDNDWTKRVNYYTSYINCWDDFHKDGRFPDEITYYQYKNGWYELTVIDNSGSYENRVSRYTENLYGNKYYFNFSQCRTAIAVVDQYTGNNYTTWDQWRQYGLNTYGRYSISLISGVNTSDDIAEPLSETDVGDHPYIPAEILDSHADITIDVTKADEIIDAYENGVSEGTSETYTDILPEIVEDIADLIYKTSSIFKIVSIISGSLSTTNSIVSNIRTGVSNLPADISTAFSGYFTDAQTGETILSRLLPLSAIGTVVASLPSWFVDQTTQESFASQTAAGVVGITDALDVSDIDIDDEDQEYPATIGGIMARIAAKVGEISTTLDGIAEDEEEDEDALDVPLSVSTAISTDVTAPNGKRSSSDINKLAILPLLFILILLLIIWLMLKVLAFVVLIFKTPVSTAFLSNGMISGLNWLKTTKITSGGGTLSMANGTGLAQAGSFINISIWSLMIFLVDLIALFAIVKVIKKWADRLHGG